MQRNAANIKNLKFFPASNDSYSNENGGLDFYKIF